MAYEKELGHYGQMDLSNCGKMSIITAQCYKIPAQCLLHKMCLMKVITVVIAMMMMMEIMCLSRCIST